MQLTLYTLQQSSTSVAALAQSPANYANCICIRISSNQIVQIAGNDGGDSSYIQVSQPKEPVTLDSLDNFFGNISTSEVTDYGKGSPALSLLINADRDK